MFLIVIEKCCLFYKGDSLQTQVWTSSYLTCWRPHHRMAGWCKQTDLVWMTCSSREGCNLNFSWGTPADICHQVYLANEIQRAASSATILPNAQACLGERCSTLSSLRTGTSTTHCGGKTIFSPSLCLVVKQTVHSVVRIFPNICVFKSQSCGWVAAFVLFSWMLDQCRFSLGILMGGQREDCIFCFEESI